MWSCDWIAPHSTGIQHIVAPLNLIGSNLFVGIHLVSAAAAAVPKDRCMLTNPFWLSFAATHHVKRPALITDCWCMMHTDLEELRSSSSSNMLQHQICPSSYPGPAQGWLAVLCAPSSARDKVSLRSCCKSADDHSSHFQRWLVLWVMAISCFRCTLTGMSKHWHACDVIVKPCSKYCKTNRPGSKMNSTTYLPDAGNICRQELSWALWPCL